MQVTFPKSLLHGETLESENGDGEGESSAIPTLQPATLSSMEIIHGAVKETVFDRKRHCDVC